MFYLLSLLITFVPLSSPVLRSLTLSRNSTISGSLYPAYASYKALKSNDAARLEVWLMYWVVRGVVMCWEMGGEWAVDW